MEYLAKDDPKAAALVTAIQTGDLAVLRQMLTAEPDLSRVRIGAAGVESRTLLHIATDWPGHFPSVAETIEFLIAAGAGVDARFEGAHTETPLHWAASSDDVAALDALLDAGADIEAGGAVIAGGTPMFDAVAFAQWNAARRLLERGAKTTFAQSAALGLMDRIENASPPADEINAAFWFACHGGQQTAAKYLLNLSADINWLPPWENFTPLDAAVRNKMADTVAWLISLGAKHGPHGHGARTGAGSDRV